MTEETSRFDKKRDEVVHKIATTEKGTIVKQKPRFETVTSPDMSIAEAIKQLTAKEPHSLKLLSNIKKAEIPRYALLSSIAEDFDLDWLREFVMSELALTNGIDAIRSRQIVEVSKAPTMINQQMPLSQRIRGRLGI